ncbi:MAG: class E sortase [Candidatus Pacebacteria bacterium]|nr:class E sortase [Candidatus Paceibacterota bacterium]
MRGENREKKFKHISSCASNVSFVGKIWKYFAVFFAISFISLNFDTYGWVFNYRVISGMVENLFRKSESQIILSGAELESLVPEIEEEVILEKEGSIKIPKIGIEAPIIFFDNPDENETILHKSLNKGVIHYPKSVLPGRVGQTIILGHSAPPGWPKIKFDWVFSKLNDLAEGDEILIIFNEKEYKYIFSQKFIINRGEEPAKNELVDSKNILLLISCWPPGKNIQRIFIEAVLSSEDS